MFGIEIYYFFTLILLVATYGLPQTCLSECKQLTQQHKYLRPECNCTIYNQSPLSSDRSISHKSHKQPFNNQPANFNTHVRYFTNKEAVKLFKKDLRELNINNENYNQGRKHDVGYPLYIDLRSSTKPDIGISLKVELKRILDKVRASEAHLSECTDLNIYIFSKNNDNINKPHTNWGENVKHDNSIAPDALTEIRNKCDHPNTVVHETVFEIKKRQHLTSMENNNVHDDTYRTFQNELSFTSPNHGLSNVGNELENKNHVINPTKILPINKSNKEDKTDSIGKSAEEDVSLQDQTHRNKTKLLPSQIRKPPKGFRRSEYLEKDLVIPKIITKEHANNTISSKVDGIEMLPNLDFISIDDLKIENVITSVEENAFRLAKIGPVKDANGDLHVSFENKLIPARFIVNSEGEKHLAVDGFSLCDRLTVKLEKYIFMKLFCECIKLNKCLP